MTDKRLIAALDFHTMEEVQTLVNKLGDSVSYYKVGMELFYSVGGEVVTWLRAQGKDVFLDLKLHDIVELKKDHPCGSRRWEVLRVGMDPSNTCLMR